ncbi:MAG TPA: EAL domain-containing protein [Candidatus Baltobacteraceae bacterium]|nr:EAL domain-containing protein [Candidatus Baltobacteraceae bacterium]
MFDRLASLAARILKVPIASISPARAAALGFEDGLRERLNLIESAFFKVPLARALVRADQDVPSNLVVEIANQGCVDLFATPLQDIVGSSLPDVFLPFVEATDRERFAAALREGRPFELQLSWSREPHLRSWHTVAASPFEYGKKETIHWLLTFRDTSESALRRSAERLRSSVMEMLVHNPPRSAFAQRASEYIKECWPNAVVTWLLYVDGGLRVLLSDRPATEGLLGANRVTDRTQATLQSHRPEFSNNPWAVPIISTTGTVLGVLLVEIETCEVATSIQREILERLAETAASFLERKNDLERIHFLALHDSLTGLPNRESLLRALRKIVLPDDATADELAVVFINLDRFKSINDTFGHFAGDRVLQEVAQRLLKGVRPGDFVARVGDAEFVCLINVEGSSSDLHERIERVRTRLTEPLLVQGTEVRVHPSIGIALFPEHSSDSETLLRFAQEAMYAARSSTRVVAVHNSGEVEIRDRFILLDAALARAIEAGELSLHYQPIIDLTTSSVHGYEALLRWKSERFGAIAPDEFIPLAEYSGLIIPIGKWVIETACRQAAASLSESSVMTVNVSARQLEDPDLLEVVHDALARSRLSAKFLVIELTESTLMRVPERALATIQELRSLGISVWIDDFGTGYSSLKVLKNLPVDGMKIDRSFLSDIVAADPSSKDCKIVAAMVDLADALDLDLVAEGIETVEQLHFVRKVGCRYAQGYLLGVANPQIVGPGTSFVTTRSSG